MAIGLKLDNSTNDISIVNGVFETVTEGDLVAQDLKTRLRTLAGEVLLDNTYGFQYKRLFEARLFDISILESLIKNYILQTNGVVSITKFNLGYEGNNQRKMIVTFTVSTIYSEFAISEEVSLGSWNAF